MLMVSAWDNNIGTFASDEEMIGMPGQPTVCQGHDDDSRPCTGSVVLGAVCCVDHIPDVYAIPECVGAT